MVASVEASLGSTVSVEVTTLDPLKPANGGVWLSVVGDCGAETARGGNMPL